MSLFEVADDLNEPEEVVTALVGLGSNLGDRRSNMSQGLLLLKEVRDLRLIGASALYETRPVGVGVEHGDFLNACALFETRLSATALLNVLLATERELGRDQKAPLAPRPLDLDLLLFGDEVIETERLIVPHPRMHRRGFVMVPAADVAPDMVHPLLMAPLREVRAGLGEVEGVWRRRKAGDWIRR